VVKQKLRMVHVTVLTKNVKMAKKRKLNSKNPKYWDEALLKEKPIKKKVLMCEPKGIKVYGVWYE
tara:strand:- start:827 stop:1021 length:195 start_codon:yes stop_codon:yes gene_type:complete